MNCSGLSKISLLLYLLISSVTSLSSISALRYGSDSTSNDLAVSYLPSYGYFYFSMSTYFQYVNSGFVMCFRQRPVAISYSSSDSCTLSNSSSSYDCLNYIVNASTVSTKYFKLSSDLSTSSNTQTYSPASTLSGSSYGTYSISLSGTVGSTSFTYLSSNSSIYEVLSNSNTHFYGSSTYKTNFITTFAKLQNITIQNLILPRNYQCYIYNNTYFTGIFYGGVIRSQTPTMMIGLVNINTNAQPFGAWQGISFSKNHAYRDMIGVVLNSGTVTDLYSLYASTPYSDTSTNVGGTSDVYLISSSGLINQKSLTFTYSTQFYRNYDTGDTLGDEVLMYKIENEYCLASYFEAVSGSSTFSGAPTSSSYKHQTYSCFKPDLSLSSDICQIIQLLFIVVMILL